MMPTPQVILDYYRDRYRQAVRNEMLRKLLSVALLLAAVFAVVAIGMVLSSCTVDASQRIDGVCSYPDGSAEVCDPSNPFAVNLDDGGGTYALCTSHACELGETCAHGGGNYGVCKLVEQ